MEGEETGSCMSSEKADILRFLEEILENGNQWEEKERDGSEAKEILGFFRVALSVSHCTWLCCEDIQGTSRT